MYGNVQREIDIPALPDQEYDWSEILYGNVQEEIARDLPELLGIPVVLLSYADTILQQNMLARRSVTGVMHFCIQTLLDWYSKPQAKFVAARIEVDQIVDLYCTLRYIGVKDMTYMFGDNQAVVNSSSIPHSCLSKRHNDLSYYQVREPVAAKVVAFVWINGKNKPADIVSKHWSYPQIWHKPFYSTQEIQATLLKKTNVSERPKC
jgi:hypothetical protein